MPRSAIPLVRSRRTPWWLATETLAAAPDAVAFADVLWCAPGSPYRSLAGALAALRFGRENGIPTLGTCGGCQHIILEFARNVLGFDDAQHAEYDPYASRLFVSELTCSLAGQTMPVHCNRGRLPASATAPAASRRTITATSG